MPAMASIVVKAADETTNLTYDALAPAGGDGSQALWRRDSGVPAGIPQGHRATLTMKTSWNGPRTARRVELTYKRPYSTQNTTTTRYETTDAAVASATFILPQAIPASEISESVRQFANLVASLLVKQAAESGFAPT